MAQTFEVFYGANAGRSGLVALVPAPSKSYTISGTNYVEPSKLARVIRHLLTTSNTVANVVETSLESSHDRNPLRWYEARDQTVQLTDIMKLNYPMMDKAGTTSTFRVLENNGNAAEICNIHAVLCSEDDAGLVSGTPPPLPSNVRPITFTGTITSVLGAWVAGTPTYNMVFQPKVRYGIYAASAWGATMTGLRFAPKAGSTPDSLYPGVPAGDTLALAKMYYQAQGKPLLEFDGANPPDIEITAVTAAAQTPTGVLLIGEI